MTMTTTAPPASGNPLLGSRLNDSRDFRPQWDVPSLNEAVSRGLLAEIRKVTGHSDADPGQMIPVLLSAGGYGKTHLFGRLAYALGDRAFFVFVGAIADPMRPLDHIRWNVVEALFHPRPGKPSVLAEALATLFHPSFVKYVADFSPAEATRHQALRRSLEESWEPVLEIASRVTSMSPFRQLAESAVTMLPQFSASVVRALTLGWSPHANVARRWLRGEMLTEEEAAALGVEENPPAALEVLRATTAILQYRKPMVICCDQLDSVLKDTQGPRQLSIQLMELLAGVAGQFTVLSCLEDAWEVMVRNQAFDAFKQRTRIHRLDFPSEAQATELVRCRLAEWEGRKPELGALWPFEADSIARFTRDKQPTPRVLLQRCAEAFEKWDEGLIEAPIAIGEKSAGPGIPELFLHEWEKELESIRQNPSRTPDDIPEARLFAAVKEIIALVQSGSGKLADLQIEGTLDGIIPSGAHPRYSTRIDLTVAGQTLPIVIAVSKVTGGNAAYWFLNALEAPLQESAGLLLIRARSDLMLGPNARRIFQKLEESGKLLLYSFDDHPAAFQCLQCALSLLDKAHAGDLQLGDTNITFDHCRRLILETQVIQNLDLFDALRSWHPVAAPATAAPSAPALAIAAPIELKPAPKIWMEEKSDSAVQSQADEPAIATASEPEPALFTSDETSDQAAALRRVAAEVSLEDWAVEKLALAASKLTSWGQRVEPVSYELGPSFVRLNVRPIGNKTTYRKVCNRAIDLKVNLGLEHVPLIGSHAYFFTIDVQSPQRRTVTLDETLAQLPGGDDCAPRVPLGLDVGGKAHWLNLADTTDCHLLVAGTTGSGKSEFLRSVVASLASRLTHEQVQFMLIDPKRVTFNFSAASPYLAHSVAYDIAEALPIVQACEQITADRFATLQQFKKTDIGQLDEEERTLIPRIVLVIDEFANLMVDKETNKALTSLLKRIGSMSRAAGIHLILATQRPDHTVVPALVRANLPGRIAFQVDSEANSELVLDSPEAAYLLGKGDLLCKRGGALLRAQSPLVTQEQLEKALRLG